MATKTMTLAARLRASSALTALAVEAAFAQDVDMAAVAGHTCAATVESVRKLASLKSALRAEGAAVREVYGSIAEAPEDALADAAALHGRAAREEDFLSAFSRSERALSAVVAGVSGPKAALRAAREAGLAPSLAERMTEGRKALDAAKTALLALKAGPK